MKGSKASYLISLCTQEDTRCIRCDACVKQCPFLQKYGLPGDIGARVTSSLMDEWPDPFECSLCGLCGGVCPVDLRPEEMFLEMRRVLVEAGKVDLGVYRSLLHFEKKGDSDLFSLIQLAQGGDTVLFPGCALPASRPKTVRRLFSALQTIVPDVGVALGCCLKPSHDLGRQSFFQERFGKLLAALSERGVKQVITTCPNCFKVFGRYAQDMNVTTAYEVLAQAGYTPSKTEDGSAVVHDPCPARYEHPVHESVRTLTNSCGFTVYETEHSRQTTFCCGEGGTVGNVNESFARHWTKSCVEDAEENRVITSCAGCTRFLGKAMQTDHILDLLFDSKPAVPLPQPFADLSRLLLKRWFAKKIAD